MPAPRSHISIKAPLAGMVRRTAFQDQPPFSAYNLSNFWNVDVATGRAALATRPQLTTFPSAGTTCNFLSAVTGHATGKPFRSIVQATGGTIFWYDGTAWQRAIGTELASVDTGQAVYGAPFQQNCIICVDDNPPIRFHYPTGEATYLEAAVGAVPEDCQIAFEHQGSLCLTGQEANPHLIYMSRTADITDWDVLADPEDEGGAFLLGGDSDGLLNGTVTAAFKHTSDSTIISTLVGGIVVLRGHPRRGGVVEQLSGVTHVLGQGAWALTPGDVAYFLTPLGLMRLAPGEQTATPISKALIPDELIGLDFVPADCPYAMAYSSRWNCLYITSRVSGSEQAWRYDLTSGAFERMTLDAGQYPYVMQEHRQLLSSDADGVLWGRVS